MTTLSETLVVDFKWGGEYPFYAPASPPSEMENILGQAGNLNPFSRRFRLSVKGYAKIGSLVSLLFGLSRPLAIVRPVWAVVVLPLYRVVASVVTPARGPWAKIGKEVFEPVPTLIHINPPSAIFGVISTLRAVASAHYPAPYAELRRTGRPVRLQEASGLRVCSHSEYSVRTWSFMA